MEETVKQHIVPSVYLKRFKIDKDEGRDTKIYYYNIINKHNGITNTNHMPIQNNYYDIEELGVNKKVLETYFNRIETILEQLLRDLFSKIVFSESNRFSDCVDITDDERAELSAQVAFMIIRTQALRDFYKSIDEQIAKHANIIQVDYPKCSKEDVKRIHNTEIFEHELANFYANLFDDCNCVFLINHTQTPFITSDNPVVSINHSKNKSDIVSATSEYVTHYFPVSPNIGLQFFKKKGSSKDKMYFDIYNDLFVNFYNNEIIKKANMFLFSNESLLDKIIVEKSND